MKSNLIAFTIVAACAGAAVPALARDAIPQAVKEVVQLKDGSTLYVFKNGKMAKEDKLGRVGALKRGEVLEAADGRKWTAVGNESARLDHVLNDGHRN